MKSKDKRVCRIELPGKCAECGGPVALQYSEYPSTCSVVIVGCKRVCKPCDFGVQTHSKGPTKGHIRKALISKYGTWILVLVNEGRRSQATQLVRDVFKEIPLDAPGRGSFYTGTKAECWGLAELLEGNGFDAEVVKV
ncbi:hypothetical protein OAU50_03735 [Planctomycetota bacterium]|nr:hypothetical protein [Planctomycetota bacterium]